MSRRKRYTRGLGHKRRERVPTRGAGDCFVRFVHANDDLGVFFWSDETGALDTSERAEVEALLDWFDARLEAPDLAGRRTPNTEAAFWFRASAEPHVERARRLATLLRRARVPIVERRSDAVPGRICFEDDAQIAVVSFWS